MTMNRRIPQRLALLGFLAIAAFFLLTEHRAHLFGALPYLLVLACPLLHFTHGGHGGHGGHGHADHETAVRDDRPVDRHANHDVGRGRTS